MLEKGCILPIIEAAKLIGFIDLRARDIHLNPIAYQFIQSNIDERKHIIRTLLLTNVQLIQKIDHLLNSVQSHRLTEELILDILTNYFSPEEAERQLNTAITWGWYAELFGYNEPSGELFLEDITASSAVAIATPMSLLAHRQFLQNCLKRLTCIDYREYNAGKR